jgi:hypothetical protein
MEAPSGDDGAGPADVVLALIPIPLVLGVLAAVVSSLSLTVAVGAGSVPASGLVGYAMFCTPVGASQ